MPPDIKLFTNNTIVRVIVSLIGVFVFFFAIFVLTYIYFKCVRKTNIAGRGVVKNDLQAQYKSLYFDTTEPQTPGYIEPQELANIDFTYLTPVFNRTVEQQGSEENKRRQENEDILHETSLHRNGHETTNRQTNNSGRIKDLDWQAQYKLQDFTYLTPVFSCEDSEESHRSVEKETRNRKVLSSTDTLSENQRVSCQETTNRQNEQTLTRNDVQEHVYIEIIEEKTDMLKLDEYSDKDNYEQINII